jgi:hypothetical protein
LQLVNLVISHRPGLDVSHLIFVRIVEIAADEEAAIDGGLFAVRIVATSSLAAYAEVDARGRAG